jgi:predicted dehydrogenase
VKVIQVGVGKMGQHWLGVLAESGQVEFAGIVEPVPALREAAAVKSNLSTGQAFNSVDDALANLDFDAAVIVTPPPTHRPLAEQLMRAGKHVLTEKPLATSIVDARALVEIAAETGRTLMVAQNYRHFAAYRTVKSVIDSGRIGAIRAVNIAFHRNARTMFGEGDFRYSMPHVLLVDMTIHHLDMLRGLTGANASRVYAQSWHVPDGNFQYDAAASVLLTMESGAIVTYTGNWATSQEETSWNGAWEIVGETGRLTWAGGDWDQAKIEVQAWGSAPEPVDLVPLPSGGQHGLIAEFVEAVSTGREPDTSAADNVNSLAIVFAAVESTETGQVVPLGNTPNP